MRTSRSKSRALGLSRFFICRRRKRRMDQILGVGIGIATVCLLLSIIASHVQEVTAAFTSRRAATLELALQKMLGGPDALWHVREPSADSEHLLPSAKVFDAEIFLREQAAAELYRFAAIQPRSAGDPRGAQQYPGNGFPYDAGRDACFAPERKAADSDGRGREQCGGMQ